MMQPLIKGIAETPDRTAYHRVQVWAEEVPFAPAVVSRLVLDLVAGFREIGKIWFAQLKHGLRVTVDGRDWRLDSYEQFPMESQNPKRPHKFWVVRLQLTSPI
jgi:hypothetical protein